MSPLSSQTSTAPARASARVKVVWVKVVWVELGGNAAGKQSHRPNTLHTQETKVCHHHPNSTLVRRHPLPHGQGNELVGILLECSLA